jgi:hypothetical protein
MARTRGDLVDPAEVYFRKHVAFRDAEPEHQWLTVHRRGRERRSAIACCHQKTVLCISYLQNFAAWPTPARRKERRCGCDI